MWCMWHLNYGTLLEYYCDVTLRYILLQGMEIHLKIICRIKGFFWKNVGGSLKTCTIQPQGNREIQKLLSISFSRASSSLTSVSFRTSAQFSSADCLPLLFVCLFLIILGSLILQAHHILGWGNSGRYVLWIMTLILSVYSIWYFIFEFWNKFATINSI